jgi:hypothetical protein
MIVWNTFRMSRVFKLETETLQKLEKSKSGVLFRSCDSEEILPNCGTFSSAQDYTVVTGCGLPQPIGSLPTLRQGRLKGRNRGKGMGLASRSEMKGRPSN